MRVVRTQTGPTDLPMAASAGMPQPVPELIVAPDGRIVDCGPGAARLLGLATVAEAQGVHLSLFCRDGERLAEALGAAAVTGRLERWDADLVRVDGKPVPAVVDLVALFEAPRTLAGVRVSIKPLSAWSGAGAGEARPVRDEASQIAHELNNLLAVISGHAECLSVSPEDAGAVDAIRKAVASAAQVSAKVRNLGPARDRSGRAVDIDAVLAAVQDELRRTFGHRVAVMVQPAPHPWMVTIDRAVVHRALAALAAEAVHAMPHGGTLTFRTMNVEVGPRRPDAVVTARPGRYVRVEVSYICTTMPTPAQPQRREPDDAGIAALEALRLAGGRVTVDTDGVRVASVVLLLPSDGVTVLRARPAAAPRPSGRRVVLVEDDATHRRLMTTLLRGQGHAVVTAETPEAAAEAAGHDGDALIVIDRVPGETPAQGAAWLAARPDLRVLGTSEAVARALALVARPKHVIALSRPLAASPLTEAVTALFAGAATIDGDATTATALSLLWIKPDGDEPIQPLEAS
jgi:CheY-like chemotaxis protein/nitrogen-specific signal transduction histidine kinase